jgi:uncharacterized RDD family membrane protein YckC
MRCPKCEYLGFEPSPRCKNCGYDFSLGTPDDDGTLSGLSIVAEREFEGPMADFDLHNLDDAAETRSEPARNSFDLSEVLASESRPARSSFGGASASAVATPPALPKPVTRPEPAPVARREYAPVAPPEPAPVARLEPAPVLTSELPLFMQGMTEPQPQPEPEPAVDSPAPIRMAEAPAPSVPLPLTIEAATEAMEIEMAAEASAEPPPVDDRPLVKVPAVLRPPLAVRRATPDPARLRAKYSRGAADNGPDLFDQVEPKARPIRDDAIRLSAEPTPESLPAEWLEGVSPGKRLLAAAVDMTLLLGLNAATVWFTLSVCGLGLSQAPLLPIVPILLFFLLLDGTYLVLLTAACGQTIGKMAAGIRVVGTTTEAIINDRVTFGQSLARAIGAVASCAPLGIGFWMSLVGDGRALHDRIAHTRVVRA